jgi:hypothetical protein
MFVEHQSTSGAKIYLAAMAGKSNSASFLNYVFTVQIVD